MERDIVSSEGLIGAINDLHSQLRGGRVCKPANDKKRRLSIFCHAAHRINQQTTYPDVRCGPPGIPVPLVGAIVPGYLGSERLVT